MPWYAKYTSTKFITKTDRLNQFDQYLVPNFFYVTTFLEAPIVNINLATCDVVDLWCNWLWGDHLNHIGVFIWVEVFFPQ